MQTVTELQDGDRIVVKKSIHKANVAPENRSDYFSLLRKKLRWNINPGRTGNTPHGNNYIC